MRRAKPRRRHRKVAAVRCVAWTCLGLLLGAPCSSRVRADVMSLSLRDAVAMAHANHPDLAVLNARIDAQNQVLNSARRAWFPTLTTRAIAGVDYDNRLLVTGTGSGEQARVSSSVAHVDGAATLDALIVDFGRRRHGIAAERSALRASEHARDEGVRRVDLSVAELFVTVLAERSLVEEAERSFLHMIEHSHQVVGSGEHRDAGRGRNESMRGAFQCAGREHFLREHLHHL